MIWNLICGPGAMPNQTVAGGPNFYALHGCYTSCFRTNNDCLIIWLFDCFKCGGVTKEHYRQMVLADEKEIAIQVNFVHFVLSPDFIKIPNCCP